MESHTLTVLLCGSVASSYNLARRGDFSGWRRRPVRFWASRQGCGQNVHVPCSRGRFSGHGGHGHGPYTRPSQVYDDSIP